MDAAATLRHQFKDVGGGRIAHVLNEVRVLLRETGAADAEPPAPRRVEELAGGASLGAFVIGVLEGRAERLDSGGLRFPALASHPGQRRLDGLGLRRCQRERGTGDDLSGKDVGAAIGEAELGGLAALGARSGADRGPLERPRELASVGVSVHPHSAADAPGDVDPELEPGESPAGRLRRR